MRLGSHDLGYGVRQGRRWIDVEDWERVLAVNKASCRQNDGNEMSARVVKQRK